MILRNNYYEIAIFVQCSKMMLKINQVSNQTMGVMFSFVGSKRDVIFCLPVAHVKRLDSIIGLRRVTFKKRAYHSDTTLAKHLNSVRIFLPRRYLDNSEGKMTSF